MRLHGRPGAAIRVDSGAVIRVRFAPSPTGYLHVGGARTALFNWLLARREGGVFVLRIEDTDAERSSDEMVDGILQGMRWLGMTWDEGPDVGGAHGPYFQSQRFDRHKAVAEELVASGHAYYDFTPPETYDEARKAAEARGEVWRYVRSEWVRPEAEARELASNGTPRAIRFKVPEGRTAFTDLVKGVIAFDNTSIDDFVIVRRDGLPIYHLSVVCDDVDMAISHVIRGDDHVSNTPKHVLLFTAMGAAVPAFAHVPMILGPDKKRLSKRHGATSVLEYKAQGYLPEAMLNFLALLGWSPGDDSELHSVDDLTARFALDGIGSASAVFNTEKLDWMNSQHIMRMDTRELATRVEPFLSAAGLWDAGLRGRPQGLVLRRARAVQAARQAAHRVRRARPAVLHRGHGVRRRRPEEAVGGARDPRPADRARRSPGRPSSRSTRRRSSRSCVRSPTSAASRRPS